MKRWLHKYLWRRRGFMAHHWGEWYTKKPIRLRHLDGKPVREFQLRRRDCICGAWQTDKLYDRRF